MDILRTTKDIDVTQDAVRPHLSLDFRNSKGRKIFILEEFIDDESIPMAYCCVAFCYAVPTNEEELEKYSIPDGKIAVAYTVWATRHRKGAGRDIIFKIRDRLVEDRERLYGELPFVDRMITLSPLTDMAYRFHTKNGATLLNHNETSYNFEYDI